MPRVLAAVWSSTLLVGCAAVPPGPKVPRFREHPRGHVMASLEVGDFAQEIGSTATSAATGPFETNASRIGLAFERGGLSGGGLQVGVTVVDDDLHRGDATVRTTDVIGADLFGHFTLRPTAGRVFRMPIRVGPYLYALTVDDQGVAAAGDVRTDYAALGLQVEIEPEFEFFNNDTVAFSAYAAGRIGFGVAAVALDVPGDDETFETTARSLGLGTGVRFRAGNFDLQAGYVYRLQTFDETDPETFRNSTITIGETDLEFHGLVFAMGVRW